MVVIVEAEVAAARRSKRAAERRFLTSVLVSIRIELGSR